MSDFARLQPYTEFGAPRTNEATLRDVQRVDLRDIPIGSIIEFRGIHPASRYILELAGTEDNRMVKIWYSTELNCLIGSIDAIISGTIEDHIFGSAETGVLEVGKHYHLPYFLVRNGFVRQDYSQSRFEPYRQIRLSEPVSLQSE